MEATLQTFQADLANFGRAIDREKEAVLRYVTIGLWKEITLRNPVDTGYSQSNWNIGVGEADSAIRGTRPKSVAGGTSQTPIGVPNIDIGAVNDIDGKRPLFVTNAVEYIRYLEDGTSSQAPSGFIRIALATIEARISDYINQARAAGFV